VVSVPQALALHESPDSLSEVEVRRVSREKGQFDADGFGDFRDFSVSLVASVVHDHGDLFPWIGPVDLCDRLADGFLVDRAGRPRADEIVVAGLNRAEDVVSLPRGSRSLREIWSSSHAWATTSESWRMILRQLSIHTSSLSLVRETNR